MSRAVKLQKLSCSNVHSADISAYIAQLNWKLWKSSYSAMLA